MKRSRSARVSAAAAIALASGCGSAGGPQRVEPNRPPATATAPPAVAEQVGEGPIAVYGASVYAPGQRIYKELRQQDSLMAFLACQGEPDRVEVVENPGGAPRIVLEYTRRGPPHRGTVAIEPSASGYYAARPIDPSGSLTRAKSAPKSEHPRRDAPPPKPSAKPAPQPETPAPAAEPRGEAPVAETAEPGAPPRPEPTAGQLDECPIEPWRTDCQDLCNGGGSWEWCQYED